MKKNKMYIIKDKDELTMTGKQLREWKNMIKQELIKEFENFIKIYWKSAKKSLHKTAPKNKQLLAPSGKVEQATDKLYSEHCENQIYFIRGMKDWEKFKQERK